MDPAVGPPDSASGRGGEPSAIRRFAGWALVAGLSLASATAIVALLAGSFGDIEVRVTLSSIGFAFTSSMGAAGAAARLRASRRLRLLGGFTLAASVAAFVLLLCGLWTNIDDWGGEGIWQAFGTCAVIALAGSHTCLVLGARRAADSRAVRTLVSASVAFGALDAFGVVLAINGVADEIDFGWASLLGVGLVLLVLTTALPPILRPLQRGSTPAPARLGALEQMAGEVLVIADRIDELNSDPGVRAPEIRRELERLRGVARAFES